MVLKKILILSYHSLPMDVIASYRAMAYLRYFSDHGYQPTLITHHWGDQINKKEVSNEDYDYGKIIRLPHQTSRLGSFFIKLEELPIINKLSIMSRWLLGFIDNRPKEINSYITYNKFCRRHLVSHNYDLVLGVFSPHHHHKLCYDLHLKFGLPYILDYRDLWNNRIIHRKYNPNLTERIQDRITRYFWKKWLSRAMFYSITSEDWKNKIGEFTDTKGLVIHNGFDPELFENKPVSARNDKFTVVHGGSLYAHQKLDVFLEGCQAFISQFKPEHFQIKFIGANRQHALPNQLSGFMHEPKKYIRKFLDDSYCEVTKRIPKEELAIEIHNCQMLLFPGIPDAPGTHLGKIFDYLGSGKSILLCPDDDSVVGELIRETNTGYICNTPEEVCLQLSKSYAEWQQKGKLKYHGIPEKINQYTRENQVKKMAEAIDEYLSN